MVRSNFDVRGKSLSDVVHWSDPQVFGHRAQFFTVPKPATLHLEKVLLEDQGIYRCRVDFRTNPTRNSALNLTVIVPPHQIMIYDNMGRNVSGVVGPLEEGSKLVLTCEVRGGNPPPTVSWFVNGRLVAGQREVLTKPKVVVNRLDIKEVTRDKLNSTFKCQASNTNLITPIENGVQLELLLRPLHVIIPTKPMQLVANEEITIHCQVTGSRPRAVVSWSRDNREFKRGKFHDTDSNESLVLSSVSFAPVPEDDGTVLKCIGTNPKLLAYSQEDSFRLNVVCK
ncbi:hypothetical protein D910_07362 [Dendroctonus ponderosae]|uniref:Ig-like domain-containing protein n=2 Tax=Dendroctonus ponderosae TaxID=77166 RepID=U4U7X3_DENPD|nr:hypothetical protein D910_07362 [Dendroctonus ponderosae]